MADLKLWGKAYALSGTVTAVITVGGTEVFNGSVTTTAASTPSRAIAQAIASVTVDDSVIGTKSRVTIGVLGGDLILMGFGDADAAHLSSSGQLKSNISIDEGSAYNVTNADIIAQGAVADGAIPGQFHIIVSDGSNVAFDNEFPAPEPAPEGPAGE